MNQSAARTLGVAVLGAAFAAAAAGSASAAALPAASALPVASTLPAGTVLDTTVTQTLPTVQNAAGNFLSQDKLGGDAAAPVAGLLGGMPTGGLTTDGLSANGLPLGR